MPTQKNKICPDCGKAIWSSSTRCGSCSKKGELAPFFGKHHSEKAKKKIRNANWKGNQAGYKAIHIWVNSRKGKPHICKYCGMIDICPTCKRRTRIEWMNKDHKYSRNLNDYVALCCGCHLKYDLANGLRTYIPNQNPKTGKFT